MINPQKVSEYLFAGLWFAMGGNHQESLRMKQLRLYFLIELLNSAMNKTTTAVPAVAPSVNPLRTSDWVGATTSAIHEAGDSARSSMREVGNLMHKLAESSDAVHVGLNESMVGVGKAMQGAGERAKNGGSEMHAAVAGRSNLVRWAATVAAMRLQEAGDESGALATFAAAHAIAAIYEDFGKAIAGVVTVGGNVIRAAGRTAVEHADTVGGGAAGIVSGVATLVGGAADAVGVTEKDIQSARRQLQMTRSVCSLKRAAYEAALSQQYPNARDRLLEQTTIGGMLISEILVQGFVPGEVAAAYASAYPVESQLMDFREKVDSLDSGRELQGLLTGVKGKLFEMTYVDELNSGGLPDGWHADLAKSATQPGWDLEIVNDQGVLQDMISLKATEHVSYVKEALDRYPDIDVVTTSEVYGAMVGTPEGAHLVDGGISNLTLQGTVQDAADGNAAGLDGAMLSLLALGPATYRHFVNSDKPLAEQVFGFTKQVTRAKTASLAGAAAMAVVPFWPAALLTAMGLSMVAAVGNNRREQMCRLTVLRDQVRAEARDLHVRTLAMNGRSVGGILELTAISHRRQLGIPPLLHRP